MAGTPEDVSRAMVRLLAEGDLDGIEALYDPDAVFVETSGVSTGWPSIRSALSDFVASGARLDLKDAVTYEAGDLALVHWSWEVRFEDGECLEGASAEVLRRNDGGSWVFVIDNSDGVDMIGRR